MGEPDGYATQREVAEFLGVNPRTLRRWETSGTGPPRIYPGRKPYEWLQVYDWTRSTQARVHGIQPQAAVRS